MLCLKCREQIEVGEAADTRVVNGRPKPIHIGCNAQETERKPEQEEIERVAELARTVY